MLKDLLSPEVQLKKYWKRQRPKLKDDLSAMMDDLFLQAADQCEENPFELILILSKQKGQAIATVYNRQKSALISMDAGQLLQSKFLEHLDMVPTALKNIILEKLEGQDIASNIVEVLKGKRILIHYDKNEAFVFVEVTKQGKKIIDINTFLDNFEF